MKMSIEERVKRLEDKVQKLEGGNLLKEEPMGKKEKVYRPLRRD